MEEWAREPVHDAAYVEWSKMKRVIVPTLAPVILAKQHTMHDMLPVTPTTFLFADADAPAGLTVLHTIHMFPPCAWSAASVFLDDVQLGTWYEDALTQPGKIELLITFPRSSELRVELFPTVSLTLWRAYVTCTSASQTDTESVYVTHMRGSISDADVAVAVRVPRHLTTTTNASLCVEGPHWTGSADIMIGVLDNNATLVVNGLRGPAKATIRFCDDAVFLVSRRLQLQLAVDTAAGVCPGYCHTFLRCARLMPELVDASGVATSMAVSRDGSWLAVTQNGKPSRIVGDTSGHGAVRVYSGANTSLAVCERHLLFAHPIAVLLTARDTMLLCCEKEGITEHSRDGMPFPRKPFDAVHEPTCMALNEKETLVAVGTSDGAVFVLDFTSGAVRTRCSTRDGALPLSICFHASDAELMVVLADGALVAHDVATGSIAREFMRADVPPLHGVVQSPSGALIAYTRDAVFEVQPEPIQLIQFERLRTHPITAVTVHADRVFALYANASEYDILF